MGTAEPGRRHVGACRRVGSIRTGWGIAVAGHPPEDPIGVMGFVVGEVGSATLGVARTP